MAKCDEITDNLYQFTTDEVSYIIGQLHELVETVKGWRPDMKNAAGLMSPKSGGDNNTL